jgi:hypothetical protein
VAREIVQVSIVVAVSDIDPVQVDSLFLQDTRPLFSYPVRRPSTGGYGDSSTLVGPGGRPENGLLGWSNPSPIAGHFNDASFNSRVLNALFNFSDVMGSEDVRGDFAKGTGYR